MCISVLTFPYNKLRKVFVCLDWLLTVLQAKQIVQIVLYYNKLLLLLHYKLAYTNSVTLDFQAIWLVRNGRIKLPCRQSINQSITLLKCLTA